jgi:hypothetical protein
MLVQREDKCISSYEQIEFANGLSRELGRRRRVRRLRSGRGRSRGRSCGCRLRRSRGCRACRRLGRFGLLLTRRNERGTGQDADVFFHNGSWKEHIAVLDYSEQGTFWPCRILFLATNC